MKDSQRPERQGPMHRLEVGTPYHPGRRSWPEGADFNYCSGHELRIFLERPTPAEVHAIESGPVEFGFFAEPLGLFLISYFGRSLSFDCFYHWQRMAEATGDRTMPPPSEETSPALRALLTIILVSAEDGIVRALRACTFSPEFTRSLHRAIAEQAAAPYDPTAHRRWADAMVAQHSAAQLWEMCTTWCRGGA
jgi:hypothetical protein